MLKKLKKKFSNIISGYKTKLKKKKILRITIKIISK